MNIDCAIDMDCDIKKDYVAPNKDYKQKRD